MVSNIDRKYSEAKEQYLELGVDTDIAINTLKEIAVSIHCWQADDIGGFEKLSKPLSGGGILTTGNYLGKPRNIEEYVNDINKAFSLIPGPKKLNLHAIYGDFKGKNIDRDEILPEHFKFWVDWANNNNAGLDFNPTPFGHPNSESGYTLSSTNKKIRNFWIEHVKRCREISNYLGKETGKTCIFDLWIQDGEKDLTVSRLKHRNILNESLNEIFQIKYPEKNMVDSLESKLFGIGSETYVTGSHEFYLSYALKNNLLLTFDTGHFHPTESVADKISSVVPFVRGIMLHISRGIRWDSDHVPVLSDELIGIMQEVVRSKMIDKVFFGTDFFDSSINRIGAYVIGVRAVQKAILLALIEPLRLLEKYEEENKLFARLAIFEKMKTMPFGYIWDYYCEIMNVPDDKKWIDEVLQYENEVLKKRQ
jgi:L-rhamnose isomerase